MTPPLERIRHAAPFAVALALGAFGGCDPAPVEQGKRPAVAAKPVAAAGAGADTASPTKPVLHSVTFETVPPEAAVFVDGAQLKGSVRKLEGTDPTRVYKVTGQALGYKSQTMELSLADGETVRIELIAEAIGPEAAIAAAAPRAEKQTRQRKKRRRRNSKPSPEPTATPTPTPKPAEPTPEPAAPKPGDDLRVTDKKKPSGSDIDVDVQWAP